MDVLECFFKPGHRESAETLSMLQHLFNRYEHVMLIGNDLHSEAGQRRAQTRNVRTIPTTVVNNEHVIEGAPPSVEHVLRRMKQAGRHGPPPE